jgi:hypothetical protein
MAQDFQLSTLPMYSSFNSGELSPLLWNRVKYDRYAPGAMLLQNFIVTKHGPIFRRPGTLFVDYANRVELIDFDLDKKRFKKFTFNRTQVFMLEFGEGYIRFFSYDSVGNPIKVLSEGVEYKITTPYKASDLTDLRFTQSLDTIYITHSLYKPRILLRKAAANWEFSDYVHKDGPYETENLDESKTLQVSATTGTATLTSNFDIFTSEMIGRHVRITISKKPGWGKITAVAGLRSATIAIQSTINGTTATVNWFLGAWYGTEGDSTESHYPAAVAFHMERLYFCGGLFTPQTIWGSRPGDFSVFSPTDEDDLVTDDMGVAFNLATDELNSIVWIKSTDSLYIGTIGPEFKLNTDNADTITPANFLFARISNYGSSRIEPQFIGNSIIFSQNSLRTLRELTYKFSEDKYQAADISLLGEHLTAVGLSSFNYQQEPHSIIWSTQRVIENNNEGEIERNGGLLLGLTYDKEQNVIAWHRHLLGGNDVEVEYVESIFNDSIQQDQIWLIVRRKINDEYVRTIEVMDKDFRVDTPLKDIYFVDCGVKYNAYSFDPEAEEYGIAVSELSGLTWLKNETVQVTVDGARHPDVTVSNEGTVTLNFPGKYITIGLQMISKYESLYIDPEAGGSTAAQGHVQNISEVLVRFYRTMGGKIGPTCDKLVPIEYRTPQDAMGEAIPLFTGEKRMPVDSNYATSAQVCITQEEPLPMMILAILPRIKVAR